MLRLTKTLLLIISAVIISLISASIAHTQSKEQKVDEKAANKAIYYGNGFYKKGDFKSAITEYEKALVHNPLNPRAAFNRGNAYYRDTTWASARTSYQTVTNNTAAPKATKANSFHNIGNTFLEENKYQEAIEAYKSSLRLQPNNYATKYNLAYAQQKLKQQQENQDKDKDKDKEKEQDKDKDKDNNKDNKDNKDQKDDQQKDDQKDKKDEDKPADKQPMKQKEMEAKLNALNQQEKKIQERKNGEKGYIQSQQKDW